MKRIVVLFMLGIGALICLTSREVPEVAAQAVAKKEIKAQGWGSVKGTVTVKGNVPAGAGLLAIMKAHADAATCCAGKGEELEDQMWIVDPKTKGVKYVAIWLKPLQAGDYFEIGQNDRQRKNPVVLDQPHCAFLPHVVAVYPEYYDGQKMVKTGESFIVKNSSPVVHNANVSGDPLKNPGMNNVIPPGTDVTLNVQAQRLPIQISCGIHSWMSAKAFVFDHPYYAITDDKGNFEIPRVPAGVAVSVMSWHEGVGYVQGGKAGVNTTFKAGQNKLDLEINLAAAGGAGK